MSVPLLHMCSEQEWDLGFAHTWTYEGGKWGFPLKSQNAPFCGRNESFSNKILSALEMALNPSPHGFVPTTKVVFISSILLYLYIFLIKLQILAFNFETLF